ncbi:MAG: LysM peptidoglycan-binding domain-containing protein [Pseudomonadota bacterium]
MNDARAKNQQIIQGSTQGLGVCCGQNNIGSKARAAILSAFFMCAAPAALAQSGDRSQTDELEYLRGIVAVHQLRLDQAEQLLRDQAALIESQKAAISKLTGEVAVARSSTTRRGAAQTASLPANGVYVVKSGDTLAKIGDNLGLDWRSLAKINNIRSPYVLNVGQRLRVPGAPQRVAATQQDAAQAAQRATAQQRQRRQAQQAQTRQAQPAQQSASNTQENAGDAPEEVGQRPDEDRNAPYIGLLSDIGGILTPRGDLFVEPEISFTATSDNRFFFQGTEILDAILIGLIEATDSDRTAVTGRFGVRYGLTSRLEIDARTSYVYRDDSVTGIATNDMQLTNQDFTGDGIGDTEVGVHYQLNRGQKFPYAILNVRAKAPTGTGPFDVPRDANGIEEELATGSGFWTVEPSLTLIAPTAPASIFANIAYQANLSSSPNSVLAIAEPDSDAPIFTEVTSFNPGDAVRISIGAGLSLNERFSMNFGYNQSNFFRTETTQVIRQAGEGDIIQNFESSAATVGSFGIGGSYAVNDDLRINLNTSFGATDEAPDMSISLRLQKRILN